MQTVYYTTLNLASQCVLMTGCLTSVDCNQVNCFSFMEYFQYSQKCEICGQNETLMLHLYQAICIQQSEEVYRCETQTHQRCLFVCSPLLKECCSTWTCAGTVRKERCTYHVPLCHDIAVAMTARTATERHQLHNDLKEKDRTIDVY